MEVNILSENEFGSVSVKDEQVVEKTIQSYEAFVVELYWLKKLRGKPHIINLIDFSCGQQRLTLPRYDLDLRNGLTINSNFLKIPPEYKMRLESGRGSESGRATDSGRGSAGGQGSGGPGSVGGRIPDGNRSAASHKTSIKINRIIPDPLEIVKALSQALLELFDQGIVHGDIRLSNILVKIKTGEIVLADFGLSVAEGSNMASKRLGVLYYRAPECRGPVNPRASWRSDMYSLGVIWLELLIGSSFEMITMSKDYRDKLHSGDIFKAFREVFKRHYEGLDGWTVNILRRMLSVEPGARPYPEELCEYLGLKIPQPTAAAQPYNRPSPPTLELLGSYSTLSESWFNLFRRDQRIERILVGAGVLYESIKEKKMYESEEIRYISLYLANLLIGDGTRLSIRGYGDIRSRLRHIIDSVLKLELNLVHV